MFFTNPVLQLKHPLQKYKGSAVEGKANDSDDTPSYEDKIKGTINIF